VRTVAAIYTSPVKSFALQTPSSVHVGYSGIAEDRRFHLIDVRGRLLTQRQLGRMVLITAAYNAETERLTLGFPDGRRLENTVDVSEVVTTQVWGRVVQGAVAEGEWNEALSDFCQADVRLVKTDGICQTFDEHPISLVSQASIDFLGEKSGGSKTFESRRFRPNFLIDGCSPHEEDFWLGGVIRIGPELRLRLVAPDPRCAITTVDPATGERDFDTPRLMLTYRPSVRAPYFGVYASVEAPGLVSLGDKVDLHIPPVRR